MAPEETDVQRDSRKSLGYIIDLLMDSLIDWFIDSLPKPFIVHTVKCGRKTLGYVQVKITYWEYLWDIYISLLTENQSLLKCLKYY